MATFKAHWILYVYYMVKSMWTAKDQTTMY